MSGPKLRDIKEFLIGLADLPEVSIEPGHALLALDQLGSVPPFLRSLLVADGTVTLALEAFFNEEIRIRTVRQEPLNLDHGISALEMNQGDECYFRQVQLMGESSNTIYASATSILNKHAIGQALFDELVDEHVGIGVILRNSAKGSFREVLSLRKGGLLTNYDLNRTYRVSLNTKPALLITEEFPLEVYL